MIRTLALLLCCATGVFADSKVRDAEAFFEGWIAEQGVPGAMIVLEGQDIATRVEAGRSTTEALEMASLAKAITAICAYGLVDEGALTWDVTIPDLLGRGPEVPLGALLTHSGGIGPDGTQGLRGVVRFYAGEDAKRIEARIHDRPLQDAVYAYNNENYALAALMIEAASGDSYTEACHERALAPAGVTTAVRSEKTGNMLAWGGWKISIKDYAAFHSYWFGQDGQIRAELADLPKVRASHAEYGLGTFFGGKADARAFWHFGGLCIPGGLRAGAHAVTYASGWTVVAAYDACLGPKAALALSQGLTQIFAAQ